MAEFFQLHWERQRLYYAADDTMDAPWTRKPLNGNPRMRAPTTLTMSRVMNGMMSLMMMQPITRKTLNVLNPTPSLTCQSTTKPIPPTPTPGRRRGFLPIVALQDNQSTGASSSQAPPPYKGSGIWQGQERKREGQTQKKSSTYRYNKPEGEQADPKGQARRARALACMRSGSTNHRTAQCTAQTATAKPSTTASGRRQDC